MVLMGKLSCLWTLILFQVVRDSSPKIPSITDRDFIDQCVRTHNELRGKVSPPAADMKYMTWEAALAKVAKAWADKCKFEHNSCLPKQYGCHAMFQYIGENIWLGGLRIFSPKFAVNSWYNETAFYNFDTLSCSLICGHYTQVVWAKSKRVGCAISLCPNLGNDQTSIFVCNYAPPRRRHRCKVEFSISVHTIYSNVPNLQSSEGILISMYMQNNFSDMTIKEQSMTKYNFHLFNYQNFYTLIWYPNLMFL
ncbi:GLIPR1-like protein 1 [Talpa occidentalis]|uniref:GLIPR1-like protein 1 n=1 Tax=Talpa occidentalis TaxID=50954 RepID=UPI0023F70E8C|nr:GLIPR1-like protein 1 [Talpa occidentalis]